MKGKMSSRPFSSSKIFILPEVLLKRSQGNELMVLTSMKDETEIHVSSQKDRLNMLNLSSFYRLAF